MKLSKRITLMRHFFYVRGKFYLVPRYVTSEEQCFLVKKIVHLGSVKKKKKGFWVLFFIAKSQNEQVSSEADVSRPLIGVSSRDT